MGRGGARCAGPIAAAIGVAFVLAACGSQTSPPAAPSTLPAASPDHTTAPVISTTPSPSASVPPAAVGAPALRIGRSAIRLPVGRSRSVALALGSEILVCGGLTSAGTTGSILRINLSSGVVSAGGTLPAPVHDAGGAVLNGAGFIFGGGRFGPGATAQRVGAAGTAASTGRLPADRADLVAVAIPGQLVLVGGGTTTFYDRRVLATTDGIHFSTIATLLVGVRYPAVAVLNGLIYVIGGSTPAGSSAAIQELNPHTGSVRLVGHLAHGLSDASAFVLGESLFIAGGRTAGRAQDALLELNATTGGVRQVGRLPYAVADLAVVVVGTTGYLIGGETPGLVASVITVSLH